MTLWKQHCHSTLQIYLFFVKNKQKVSQFLMRILITIFPVAKAHKTTHLSVLYLKYIKITANKNIGNDKVNLENDKVCHSETSHH